MGRRGALHDLFVKYPLIGKIARETWYNITVPNKKPRQLIKFEFHVAEHCNLNCKCCDNFSPLAEKEFINFDVFCRDIERMSKIFKGEAEQITLIGGEPLLNEEICDIIKMCREHFPKCKLRIGTNGLLLKSMKEDFWKTCHESDTEIAVSYYPITLDMEGIKKIAEKYTVNVIFEIENGSITENYTQLVPLDLKGKQNPKLNFKMCPKASNCVLLKNGKLYTCSLIPNIVHFNRFFDENLPLSERDYIDIYENLTSEEILKLLVTVPDFCRYCNFANAEYGIKWDITKYERSEWAEG